MPYAHDETVKILFLAGGDGFIRNKRGIEQAERVNKRKGTIFEYGRVIKDPAIVYKGIELADLVISVGNQETIQSYPERYWGKIKPLSVTASNTWSYT